MEQGDPQHPLAGYPETSRLSMPHCTPPSELPRVLEDTPAPTDGAGLNDTRVFFQGEKATVFLGWQRLTPNAQRLERGGL